MGRRRSRSGRADDAQLAVEHPERHIFDETPESLGAWCAAHGMAGFRSEQILKWVYEQGVGVPAAMLNLSKADRELLGREFVFVSGRTIAHRQASDGTQKLLVQWDEFGGAGAEEQVVDEKEGVSLPIMQAGGGQSRGARDDELDAARQTECVMIPSEGRQTACISSQVGCPVGCRFCASGLGGLDGNLSTGRIVEQVWRLGQLQGVGRISNVVFMGMGEPLANFGAVKRAVETIAAPWGLGIGARKITISTVGLPAAIERLARELDLPVTLALSLHAPNDELRRQLIPWSEHTTIDALVAACEVWFKKTGREITLEYILLGGVNDQEEHAQELARVTKRLRANVNLIRYNEVAGLEFRRPQSRDVLRFQEVLRGCGVNAHIRASRGRDIEAACGQLRHETAGAG